MHKIEMFKYTIVCLFVCCLQVDCLYGGDTCNVKGQFGTCRLLAQCPVVHDEVRRAGQPMPLYIHNWLQELMCGIDGMKLKVCCPTSSTGINKSNPSVRNWMEGLARWQVENNDNYSPKDVQRHPNLYLLPTSCGSSEENRIVGGQETVLFEMPWMVILSYNSERGKEFGCGGTLINERYVLTAAHCVPLLGSTVRLDGVILGEYDVTTNPDCTVKDGVKTCAPKVKNATIEQVIVHPGFTHQARVDDIALIRLAQPTDISLESVRAICLPVTHALQTESLVGKNGLVAGWGFTESGFLSSVLLKVNQPILSKEDCNAKYKGEVHVINKQICAGAINGTGSCGGDSGGPLTLPDAVGATGARVVQRGIVSFGPTACGTGYPGVYTNLAYYMDWILDHIRP